jgi:hypothetical protein
MQVVNSETRQWMAGEWLSGATLAPLVELNAQCLELVCDMAARGHGNPAQLAVGRQIAALAPEARKELAHAPYLLVDAGFDNPMRWQGLASWRVQDMPRDAGGPFSNGPAASAFIRGVYVYGWHLSRAHRQLARVVLGMTPACARTISGLGLKDLDWACDHRQSWVTLRWEARPQLWAQLLGAARTNDRAAMHRASLRGIQLLGALALERKGT